MPDQISAPVTEALVVEGLDVDYRTRTGSVSAVRGVDLTLASGQILGLVGESGSGKSTVALAIAGLLPASARVAAERVVIVGSSVRLGGSKRDRADHRSLLGSRMGVVFQDPTASLDPTMRIGRQIEGPIRWHQGLTGRELRDRVSWLLDRTGLASINDIERRFPHELSGGQKQRVMIAMGIACGPSLLIADEPTTALDVTVQAGILRLLSDLRREHE